MVTTNTSSLLDAEAVNANRRNELTPRQREGLINMSSNAGWFGCGLAAVVTVAVVLAAGKWLEQHEIIGFGVIIGILIISFLVGGRIVSIPMRSRLANAQVEQVSGEVIWQGSDYVAMADGRPLRSIFNEDMTLLPGKYNFFRLERSNWLLSAQHLDPVSGSPVSPVAVSTPVRDDFAIGQLQSALNLTNGFRAQDLPINKNGRLSSAQRMSLLRESAGSLFFGAVFIGLVIFSVIVGVRNLKPGDMLQLLAALGVFGFVGYIVLSNVFAGVFDALTGRVETVSGLGTKYTKSGRRNRRAQYHYRIGGMTFGVSHTAYEALIENVPYKAYYTRRSKKLVNLEVG